MAKKYVTCRYCKHKLSRPVTIPTEDYISVDYCPKCKRYLCITMHPDGSVDMKECHRDYEPEVQRSIHEQNLQKGLLIIESL